MFKKFSAARKDKKFRENLEIILDALIDDTHYTRREAARDSLKHIEFSEEEYAKVMDALLDTLVNRQFWPRRNKEFVEVLVELGGNNAIEPLCDILETRKDKEHAQARAVSAYTLGEITVKKGEKTKIRNGDMTHNIYSLGDLTDQRVVSALIQCFMTEDQDDDGKYVGAVAWQAIDDIGSTKVSDPLLDAIEKNELAGSVRDQDMAGNQIGALKLGLAFRFLGYCSEERAIPVLVESLKDENEEISFSAAAALICIGSSKALKELFDATKMNVLGPGALSALKRSKEKDMSFQITWLTKWFNS